MARVIPAEIMSAGITDEKMRCVDQAYLIFSIIYRVSDGPVYAFSRKTYHAVRLLGVSGFVIDYHAFSRIKKLLNE